MPNLPGRCIRPESQQLVVVEVAESLELLLDLLGQHLVDARHLRRIGVGCDRQRLRLCAIAKHDLDLRLGVAVDHLDALGSFHGAGGVEQPGCGHRAWRARKLHRAPQRPGAVEGVDELLHRVVEEQPVLDARELTRARHAILHSGRQVAEDAIGAPVGLDALLYEPVDVGPERLGRLARRFAGLHTELAFGPAEALDHTRANLLLQGQEQRLRVDDAEIEQRRALPAAPPLHVLRDLQVGLAADPARVHQLDTEGLTGEIGLREDRYAVLQQERLFGAIPAEAQRAVEARAVQLEQEPR